MTWRVHDCPGCRCNDDDPEPLVLNTAAPFYGLVHLVDEVAWAETTAKHVAARAQRKAPTCD